jgi:tRNA pseudouridine55 synthase
LLIVCLGRATKLVRFLAADDKQYTADIMLGIATNTFDRCGAVTGVSGIDGVSRRDVETALDSLSGSRSQIVPGYSAAKYCGRPMYEYARKRIDLPERYRDVVINKIELKHLALPRVAIEVNCSKGTYIRSLANELGDKLGCGAHLFSLRRTSIGRHSLEDSLTLNQIAARKELERLDEKVIPISDILDFPALTVAESRIPKVADGVGALPRDIAGYSRGFSAGETVSLVASGGRLLAVGEALLASSDLERCRSMNLPVFKYLRVV